VVAIFVMENPVIDGRSCALRRTRGGRSPQFGNMKGKPAFACCALLAPRPPYPAVRDRAKGEHSRGYRNPQLAFCFMIAA
jgi:hypothetical protein